MASASMQLLRRTEELRDRGVAAHEGRVSRVCRILCTSVGLDRCFAEAVVHSAGFHDIGKLAISDALLLKPGRLTDDEMTAMKAHASHGHGLLIGMGNGFDDVPATVALSHHEQFDGKGYPEGLEGAEIPFSARIVAVCDVYDALREDRPYRAGMSHEAALGIITRGDGRTSPTAFDPIVLGAFASCASEIAVAWHSDPNEPI